ncbi:MAG: sigma 54-interacting transcriptional regulator [Deltaproteobacteria bacterium]|nr:sigma 54-interacting transcriptional regulator [Deltaproteobacteria bacterium]
MQFHLLCVAQYSKAYATRTPREMAPFSATDMYYFTHPLRDAHPLHFIVMEWIDGRYRVVRALGQGSAGEVWLVTDTTNDTLCALKWLRPAGAAAQSADDAVSAFKQEFRWLQELRHAHIAEILDFGRDATSGRVYFTQRFIDGVPIVEASAGVAPDVIEQWMVQALRALEFLQARRICHGDIKSANLLVERTSGRVQLIDFGLANLPGHTVAGTPATMAPEVWRGELRDGRADLYALGAVWYHCLTGANPFVAESLAATRERHLQLHAAPLHTVCAAAPPYLTDVLARLLAKSPQQRYPTAAAVIHALNQRGAHDYAIETVATSVAYLPDAGPLIGRAALWERLQQLVAGLPLDVALVPPIVLLVGARGLGKSRVARELVALAQLRGCRVTCEDADGPRSPAELGRLRAAAFGLPQESRLFVITAGPDEANALQAWLPTDRVQRIDLTPFDRGSVAAYLRHVTGMAHVPDPLVDALLARSEGNPAWLRELCATCLQRRQFVDAHGRWHAANFADLRAELERLPVTIGMEAWFAARRATLSPDTCAALECLSVAQHPLPVASVPHLLGPAREWRGALAAAGWLTERDALVVLSNPGVREWARGALPPARRMAWHDRFVACAAELPDEPLDYHRAFGSDPAAAAHGLRRYVAQCARDEAWPAAIEALRWAWHARSTDPVRVEWGVAWVNALVEIESPDVDAVANSVAQAIDASPESEQWRWRAALAGERIEWHLRRGDADAARAAITALLQHEPRLPLAEVLRLKNYLGRLAIEAGAWAEAHTILTATWAAAAALPTDTWIRTANNDLALLYLQQHDYASAQAQCAREWERLQTYADQGLEARCRYNWGEAYRGLGDYAAAMTQLSLAYTCASAVGHHALTLRILNGLGNLAHQQGDAAAAIEAYERGLRVAARLGCLRSSAALATNLSILLRANGRPHDAATHLTQVEHWLRPGPRSAADEHVLVRALLERARLAHEQQDVVAARALLTEAETLARDGAAAALLPFITDAQREVDMSSHTPTPQSPATPALQPPDPTLPWQRVLAINQQLARITDLPSLLTLILSHAVALANAELGLVLLLDATNALQIAASYNVQPDAAMSQVSATIARRAMESGRALVTDDAAHEADWNAAESVVLGQLRAVLCLPIHAAGRVIGGLYLSHRLQSGAFHDADTTLLAAFADQTGLAIERAQLLAAAAARTAQLAATVVERETEIARLEATSGPGFQLKDLRSHAPRMGRLFELLKKILPTDLSVCLHGETGTGKEVIARLLHAQHPERAKAPFIPVCCGAIPKELMESELFGYRAGAFTGAVRDKAGLFEAAHGGTLFLDEVAELPLELQPKLLRVLQEREVRRLGDTTTRTIDCRIIAASHRALLPAVRAGTFREDLYYRLCQIQLELPPLRERREDLPMLVEHFLRRAVPGKAVPQVHRDVWRRYMAYDWPGNVRELEHLLTAMCALCDGKVLRVTDIPPHHPLAHSATEPSCVVSAVQAPSAPRQEAEPPRSILRPSDTLETLAPIDPENHYDATKSWRDYERLIVAKALAHYQWDARRAATALGLSPAKVYKLVQQIGLRDPAHPLHADPFRYRDGERLGTYMAKIFAAALRAHHGHPYPAIRALQVSPGYFYKVIPTTARHAAMDDGTPASAR